VALGAKNEAIPTVVVLYWHRRRLDFSWAMYGDGSTDPHGAVGGYRHARSYRNVVAELRRGIDEAGGLGSGGRLVHCG
jgi:hypothetical protein